MNVVSMMALQVLACLNLSSVDIVNFRSINGVRSLNQMTLRNDGSREFNLKLCSDHIICKRYVCPCISQRLTFYSKQYIICNRKE
jgi:hypothetical protein